MFTNLWIIFKHPLELGRGEVAIEQEAGLSAEQVWVDARGERITDRLSACILPDDGGSHRLPRILIPKDESLALVIESGRGDLIFIQQGCTGFFDCANDIDWILLYPPCLRTTRRQLRRVLLDHFTVFIDNDCCRLRCALIDTEKIFHWVSMSL